MKTMKMTKRRLYGTALCALLGGAALPLVPALADPQHPPPAAPEQKGTVSLSFHTKPPKVHARVTWGRKLLGEAPFVLKWPRDSGPLDVVVSAKGYLPVHTRVYTFGNDTIYVKLTAEADKKMLFGYKHEAPPPSAGDGGITPDGGAPTRPDGGAPP